MIAPKPIRLGILTPSSNTALEPLTQALVHDINTHLQAHNVNNPAKPCPLLNVHFSRFPVTRISLAPTSLSQFMLLEPILDAAQLLAHAQVDIIGWSGTSAGWLGFDNDVMLCMEIERVTGIKATTSVLALNRALQLWGVGRLGLVTPYTTDVQDAIVKNYRDVGFVIGEGMERHLGLENNTDIAAVGEEILDEMVEKVVGCEAGVEAVTTFCTNLSAAQRVEFWERKYGVPVFDTVTTVVWDMLRETAVKVKGLRGWGMIFERG